MNLDHLKNLIDAGTVDARLCVGCMSLAWTLNLSTGILPTNVGCISCRNSFMRSANGDVATALVASGQRQVKAVHAFYRPANLVKPSGEIGTYVPLDDGERAWILRGGLLLAPIAEAIELMTRCHLARSMARLADKDSDTTDPWWKFMAALYEFPAYHGLARSVHPRPLMREEWIAANTRS